MLHLLLYGLLAILLAGALFLLASRLLPAGEQIAPPLRDEPPWDLPAERALSADDVDSVRLPVALRGYRFAETDQLLDRLAEELRARDAVIARLTGTEPEPGVEPAAAAGLPAVAQPGEAGAAGGAEPRGEIEPRAADKVPAGDAPAGDAPAGDAPARDAPAEEEPEPTSGPARDAHAE